MLIRASLRRWLAAGCFALLAPLAHAATFTVTTTSDSGAGSLREAIADAALAANPGADTIGFDAALSGGTISLGSEIVLASIVTIDSTSLAAGITINGNSHRIFTVSSGQTVALTRLTLTGGNGIGVAGVGSGGAIYNSGTLALTHCTLSGNQANGSGGAIFHSSGGGTLALTHCTLAGNQAGANGGAVFIAANSGALTLRNSIVSGNIATGGAGNGPDIFNSGTITREGVNIVQTAIIGTAPTGPGTILPADAHLAALGTYGGTTKTMPPLAGSPAIDAASVVAGLTTDQRGAPLPGSARDIGAVELGQIVVNTTADENDGITTNGISLREAVTHNAPFEAELIRFAPALSGAILTLSATAITVSKSLALVDAATLTAGLTITDTGATSYRLFTVNSGSTVAFHGLTLSNGGGAGVDFGGAIRNGGTLTLTHCTLAGNQASGLAGGGGAIYNLATLVLANCTLSGNFVTGSGSGGGAIYQGGGALSMLNCTITQNDAGPNSGGGLLIESGTAEIGNSIIAGNTALSGPDISGAIDSLGFNIIGDATGVTIPGTPVGDQIGVNPQLDADGLAFNGGPTQTIALLGNSPAIDRGNAFGSVTTDQRGRPRPFDNPAILALAGGDGSDIGAFEAQAAAPEIAVQQVAGVDLLAGASTFDFGTQDVSTATPLTFKITNKGSLPLTLTGTTFTGMGAADFAVTVTPASPVAAGASTTFTVSFMPGSTGVKPAVLAVASNDADEGTFNIALTGNAVETLTVPPRITSPTPGGAVFPMATVTFTLPEAALAGSVKITFNNGTAYESVLTGANETAGSHTVIIDTAAASMPLGTYALTLAYRDTLSHASASVTHTNVAIRPANAVSTALLAQGAAVPGAGTNGLVPGDALLASFGTPATDDDGDLAFLAKWTSVAGGKGSGLFLNSTPLAIVGGDAAGITGTTGAEFRSFTDPVTDAGRVASIAALTGVPKSAASAVVSNTAVGGPLEVIAQAGDDATADGAKFKSFKAVDVEGDYTAVFAQLAANTGTTPKTSDANDLGLWVKDGADPLVLALREGQTVAGKVIKTLVSFASGAGSPGQGRGWLRATPAPGGQVLALAKFTDKSQGIVLVDADDIANPIVLSLTAQTGGGSPDIAAATFASYSFPALAQNDTSAFLASLTANVGGVTEANARGVFHKPALAGDYTALVRLGDAAVQGAKFSVLQDPVLAADGSIAFPATIKGGTVKGIAASTLWWSPAGGTLALLAQGGARPGADLPAQAQWKSFTSLAIAAGRGPIFSAKLVPGKGGVLKTTASGVWACDFTGAPRVLFRTGDTIGGKIVKKFTLLNASVGSMGVTRSFNDAAEVVWLATFTDKTTAIIRTEVP